MLFSSMTFIYIFLPIVCSIYILSRKELRNYWLLVASVLFYAWGEPRYLAIMLITIVLNYFGGILISEIRYKKVALVITIFGDLSFLCYFKYFNFFIDNYNLLTGNHVEFIKVALPIGISFYTFQAISYVIDVYRGDVQAQKDILKLALYIALFPQLVAGPIIKYHDISEQIDVRTVNFNKVVYGVKRFIIGLSKKVLIANTVGEVADKIFSQPISQLDFSLSWLGALCYALQVYYDFSGYSDMAIGLGSIFGFKFLENFNYPFISSSISEYWRRWHIALGSWFRDYMFLPFAEPFAQSKACFKLSKKVGRTRAIALMTFVPLFIVWFCTGFWHGASWNFIIWGLYNGFFIFIEFLTGWNKKAKNLFMLILQHVYALLVIITSFVIFRSETFSFSCEYLLAMFAIKEGEPIYTISYYVDRIELVVIITGLICSVPIFKNLACSDGKGRFLLFFIDLWLIVLFILSSAYIAAGSYNPFIYFRF